MNPYPKNNATAFQEMKREETFQKIDAAIEFLRASHLTINRSRIAEEAGLSRSTMNKPHVREYLSRFPEFSENAAKSVPYLTPEQYEEKLAAQNNQLKISREKNKRLTEEKEQLSEKYRTLKKDYELLLGDYQILAQKKIVHF